MIKQVKLPLEDALGQQPKIVALEFYVDGLAQVNRDGIPKQTNPEEFPFSDIHDLDYLCQASGGKLIDKQREHLVGGIDAATTYRVGNVAVVNRTFGHWPYRKTTILMVEGETPNQEVINRFKVYYQKEPQRVSPVVNQTVQLRT